MVEPSGKNDLETVNATITIGENVSIDWEGLIDRSSSFDLTYESEGAGTYEFVSYWKKI